MKLQTLAQATALSLATLLLWQGSAAAQSAGDGISNFLNNLFSPKQGDNAPPQAAPGPLPWSGEYGASGDPLMTASAIREAAANFDNCVAGLWPDAARRGISQESFQRFTVG